MRFSFPPKMVFTFLPKWFTAAFLLGAAAGLGQLLAIWLTPPLQFSMPQVERVSSPNLNPSLQPPSFLFGKVDVSPNSSALSSVALDQDTLQQTRLNLKLIGLVYTPQRSVALIEDGATTQVVMVGDALKSEVEIQAIYPDFVVLRNRGVLERLALEKSALLPPLADRKAALGAENGQNANLQQIRDSVRQSPLTINRYVRFRMLQRAGEISAIQVWPRNERQLFESLGFQSGDKILQVDGTAVGVLSQNPQQLQQLFQKTRFDLLIERGGQQQTLSVVLP
ncbi:MAG: hypothetical protein JXR44_09490 [Thiotrichales bacterium]|nr:hypothetical protein [Thiotrichales bacterium]